MLVLEIGRYTAAPLLGMLLADQGARVVKIEPPGGDPSRGTPLFAVWNRNKESLSADLGSGSGREHVRRLAARADIVIEDLTPGITDDLRLGYEELRRDNGRLIYASLPGFPAGSPYRAYPGFDDLVSAATGVFQRGPQSTSLGLEPTPLYSPLLLPSTFAALAAAGGITAALIVRARSGLGQRIEMPLYSAVFAGMGMFLVHMREREGSWSAWNKLPLPAAYRCADERWIQAYGGNRRQLAAMFAAFGHPEWTDDAFAILEEAPSKEVVEQWRSRFEQAFASRDSWEWERAISDGDGVSVVCRTFDEFLALRHTQQAHLMIDVDDKACGRMRQLGVAVNLRSSPGGVRRPAPELNEHAADLDALEPRRAPTPQAGVADLPLSGIRVLDLSILLAGPSCGRTLAEYGADVLKIDDPGTERRSDWPRTRLMWLDVSRGKRSIRLDLKQPAGREVFWQLVESADVIIENFRAGRCDATSAKTVGPTKLEKLGLGYDDVRKRKPDVIYLSISAFGRYGELTHWGGYEQAGQAIAGIMVRHGGRGHRPLALAYPFNDYGTGLVAVYGVMLALLERGAKGRGQHVDTSLASTACLLASRYAFEAEGSARAEIEGPSLLGEKWCQRYYKASDGWLFVRATDADAWRALTQLEEFAQVARDRRFQSAEGRQSLEGALSSDVGAIFGSRLRAYWLDRLRRADLLVVEHATTVEVRSGDVARSAGLVRTACHPAFGSIDHGGPVMAFSGTPLRVGAPAPLDGGDTDRVLAELGYDIAQIQALRDTRVVD